MQLLDHVLCRTWHLMEPPEVVIVRVPYAAERIIYSPRTENKGVGLIDQGLDLVVYDAAATHKVYCLSGPGICRWPATILIWLQAPLRHMDGLRPWEQFLVYGIAELRREV